jgi:hypothetical protein
MIETAQLFSVLEASEWATNYIGKNVTTSNIAYGKKEEIVCKDLNIFSVVGKSNVLKALNLFISLLSVIMILENPLKIKNTIKDIISTIINKR